MFNGQFVLFDSIIQGFILNKTFYIINMTNKSGAQSPNIASTSEEKISESLVSVKNALIPDPGYSSDISCDINEPQLLTSR